MPPETMNDAQDRAESGAVVNDNNNNLKMINGGGEGNESESSRSSDAEAAPPANAPPSSPTIFIKGLYILPPRQKKSSSADDYDDDDDINEYVDAIALPPLRPEEPVSSLRGALGEVLGYAHFTRYRLVVERTKSKQQAKKAVQVTGKGGGSQVKKKPIHRQQQQPQQQQQQQRNAWSPYTLKDALVAIPQSLKSLEASHGIVPSNAATGDEGVTRYHLNGDSKKKEVVEEDEVEIVLDEYGDLSILLPLLMTQAEKDKTCNELKVVSDDEDNDHDGENIGAINGVETIAAETNVVTNNLEEEKIILNAKKANIVLRVILERYDLASIRDHVTRVRDLVKGNAPYVTSLVGVEEVDVEDVGGVTIIKEKTAKDTISATEEEKKDVSTSIVEKSAFKENGEEPTAQDGRAASSNNFAKFPPCLPEYDLLVNSALKDGDLTHFYFLACGEEAMLHKLLTKSSKVNNMDNVDLSLEGISIQDENMNNGGRGGTGRNNSNSSNNSKKKRNKSISLDELPTRTHSDTSSSTNGTNNNSENNISGKQKQQQTVSDMDRRLYDLNDTTHIRMTIRLSGYHPPPPHRRVVGDLAYLEVTLPDGSITHVTAFMMGYHINRSSMTRFDPTPVVTKNGDKNGCCYSHALLDCLLQKSTSLRTAWQSALVAAKERSDLLMQLSSPSSSLSSPSESDGGVGGVSDDTNNFDEDFVLYNNIFRNVASAYPNNASGPSASAAGAGSMTLNFLSSTSPTSFVPRLDMLTIRPPWLVPLPLTKMGDMAGTHQSTWDHDKLHTYDGSRAEEELTSYFGMDIRGGGLRDWNEELQTAREMPVSIFGERMERARLIHKILSDFGDAAILGVKAMLDGYIQPMNPNEQARSHVFLHNNIFFSRAIDAGLDTFKIIQGDAAAKKSASRDAHNIGVLHRLDVPGLHTLATVLVEYLGMRIVCQSVLPGILHGEKSHSILCGAVETLSKFQSKDEMLKLLESSIGQACMIATRAIPVHPLTDERMDIIKKYRITPVSEVAKSASMNEKGEEETKDPNSDNKFVQFCGPMEMKGILGSDKRKYVLDCTRLTPRDANWVSVSNGGTGRWEELYANQSTNATFVPPTLDDDEWTVCVLRSELFASYAAIKIAKLEASTNVKDTQDEGTMTESDSNVATINTIGEEKEIAPEGGKNETTEQMKTDSIVQKLRFNVNVFLPYTRSVEGIDNSSYETIKQDEEEARHIARHLWDTVIPNLTKEIRSSSVSGLQIPVDGRSLTDLIHLRGINCRYLGRLADAAKQEECDDTMKQMATKSADTTEEVLTSPARFGMPHCWLELLECEMVARAAKHVLDSYMIERASSLPAQMIASFLSAIMSVGEESAGETEQRISKENINCLDQDKTNALTVCFDTDDFDYSDSTASKGRGEIWADIEREVGRRYRYTLSLYNDKSLTKKDGKEGRALYMPLLRRICQRSGIRLVARKYDLGKKCVCVGGRGLAATYPIAPTDILDVLPLVRHAASICGESFAPCTFSGNNAVASSLYVLLPDAKTRIDIAHERLTTRNDPMALEYAQEASAMYQQVVESPLHPQISKCLKLTAIAYFHRDQPDLALTAALKHLAVTLSLNGFDSVEVLNAHLTLSDILLRSGIPEGVRHLRAANFLMEFMAGKNYAGISSQYYRMGSHYYDAGKLEDALRYFEAAASKRSEDCMFDCIIARQTSGILARLGRFKQAIDYEKTAYQLYITHFGETHEATKVCAANLERLTKVAVEQEKVAMTQEKERVKESAANAVADEIRAFEEAEEAKPIKKKKHNKKKGKK